jgi:hypothetical protein
LDWLPQAQRILVMSSDQIGNFLPQCVREHFGPLRAEVWTPIWTVVWTGAWMAVWTALRTAVWTAIWTVIWTAVWMAVWTANSKSRGKRASKRGWCAPAKLLPRAGRMQTQDLGARMHRKGGGRAPANLLLRANAESSLLLRTNAESRSQGQCEWNGGVPLTCQLATAGERRVRISGPARIEENQRGDAVHLGDCYCGQTSTQDLGASAHRRGGGAHLVACYCGTMQAQDIEANFANALLCVS